MNWYQKWREKRKRKKEEQKTQKAKELKDALKLAKEQRIKSLKEEYEITKTTYNELLHIFNRIKQVDGEYYAYLVDKRINAKREIARTLFELKNLGVVLEEDK